jgi:hypothetical protein
MKNAARGWAALDGRCKDPAATVLSLPAARNQDPSPLEHHHPLADDKLVLFELAPVHRLIGHVQGPGVLGDLLRRGRP